MKDEKITRVVEKARLTSCYFKDFVSFFLGGGPSPPVGIPYWKKKILVVTVTGSGVYPSDYYDIQIHSEEVVCPKNNTHTHNILSRV